MPFKYNPFTNRLDYYESGGGGGTVTSVSGTANRITVTNPTTTPVIDIAATYIGQTSITTLGTITTGTWNGTAIGPTFGGTGQTTYATGDILYASGVNTLAKLAAGSDGNVLTLASGLPSWAAGGAGTPQGMFVSPFVPVDYLIPGSVTIYTPPQDFVVMGLIMTGDDVTDRVGSPQFTLGTNSPDYNDLIEGGQGPSDTVPSFLQVAIQTVNVPAIYPVPASTDIIYNISVPALGTTYSGQLAVYGYFIS